MNNKLTFLIVLSVLAVPLVTNCDTPSGGIQPPRFSDIGIMGDIILVVFDKTLSGSPDSTSISVKQDFTTFTPGIDYTLSINGNMLVIQLKTPPILDQEYTVILKGGAVTSVDGKTNEASEDSNEIKIVPGIEPFLLSAPSFKTGSDTELTVTFTKEIKIIDLAKIKLLVKAPEELEFSEVQTSEIALDEFNHKKLKITLATPALADNAYRIVVGFGGVKSGDMFNNQVLTSGEVRYSIIPILDSGNPPYIRNNKLILTFNMEIALKAKKKIKVFRNSFHNPHFRIFQPTVWSVNASDKTKLEISLPYANSKNKFRVELEAGAVGEDGNIDNENKAIAPEDTEIIMKSLAELIGNSPYMMNMKIVAIFDKEIEILDASKIKYQFKDGENLNFQSAVTPKEPPIITPSDKTRLEIPLNNAPKIGQVYRLSLDAGAIGGVNIPSTSNLVPTDRNITVSGGISGLWHKPVFESERKLSVSLGREIAVLDTDAVKVESKDKAEETFTIVTERNIAVDDKIAHKINITLGQDIKPYTQIWKVSFPPGSVLDVKNRDTNRHEIIPTKTTFRLSDLYKWKEVGRDSVKWSARRNHTSVVFAAPGEEEKIWVLGGYSDTYLNDVWNSRDGSTWTKVKDSKYGGWSKRQNHTSVVFDNKIWVLGGADIYDRNNDVWNSTDGITWENAVYDAKWSDRQDHSSVVFDNKIWVIGGYSTKELNDVWSSEDGSLWIEESAEVTIPWNTRYRHSSVVFDDKIWVIEGSYQTENSYRRGIWHSADGRNWIQKPYPIAVKPFEGHSSIVFKNRIWNLGGKTDSRRSNLVYSIADTNSEWTEEKAATWFWGRTDHTNVVFDDGNGEKIWVLSGRTSNGNSLSNKVWSLGRQ